MKLVFYTYDLFPGREYLMPWRTLLEVAKAMPSFGHQAIVLNGCNDKDYIRDYVWDGVEIVSMTAGYDMLVRIVEELESNMLFFPVTWRDGLKDLSPLGQIRCRKIAYLPGGVYDIRNSLLLLRHGTLSIAKPYLLESVVPTSYLGRKLRETGFDATIGLTYLSSRNAEKGCLPSPVCILPGKDAFDEIDSDMSVVEQYGLMGKKWMLFTGSPAVIRGSSVLLQALDKVKCADIRIVMLIRGDRGADMTAFEKEYGALRHPERVIVIKEKLTRPQLRGFFGSAWYAVLPFLTVPSEVPLTYFELLSCGTPVVSFPNGGTTEYLNAALTIATRSIKGLAKALEKAWSDDAERANKSKAGLELMAKHPDWNDVAQQWVGLINTIKHE